MQDISNYLEQYKFNYTMNDYLAKSGEGKKGRKQSWELRKFVV